jgi:hypothetical protein
MITFKEYIAEAKQNKTAVISFGRLNPPTVGHAKLIDHMLKQKGDKHLIISHSQDNKKNPLSAAEKADYVKKMYPDHDLNIHQASKDAPTIFHHAAALHKQGYDHLHMIVGEDRVKEFHDSLNKYNGVFKDGVGYKFKKITVSSAGDRDPDAEGTEGMSASKMRVHAMSGNEEEFKKGLHPNLHPHAQEIMTKIKERLSK